MSYTRVNWENLPSTNTPLNATNLNKMDAGIKTLDDNYNAVAQNNITITSDYTIDDNSCFKSQNFVNIGINIFNSSGTYGTYSWVDLARLPEGYRPTREKYISGYGCSSGWGTPTAVPIMINAEGYIRVYLQTSGLKRIVASGIITL